MYLVALMPGDVDTFTLSFDILYGVVTDVLKRLKVLFILMMQFLIYGRYWCIKAIRRVVVPSCKKNDFMKEYIYNLGLPVQITETLYEIKYVQSKLVYYFNGFRNHFRSCHSDLTWSSSINFWASS